MILFLFLLGQLFWLPLPPAVVRWVGVQLSKRINELSCRRGHVLYTGKFPVSLKIYSF
jgi:hypothetical protein